MPEQELEHHSILVKHHRQGRRIDHYISGRFPAYSRSYMQKLIRRGMVRLNGEEIKPSAEIRYGDVIDIDLPVVIRAGQLAEDIPLDIVYEDNDFVALNKPAGMVTHPAKGHSRGTLVNALLYHCNWTPDDPEDVRPGVVHRLDKNTTGIMLFAKHELSQSSIQRQFQERNVAKSYLALVQGDPQFDEDIISKPLTRHAFHRERQAVCHTEGKESVTYYKVLERFGDYSFVEARPRTGRTHQIRVHLASIKHPVVCDTTYGARRPEIYRSQLLGEEPSEGEEPLMARTALHAWKIELNHPTTRERVSFRAEPPADFAALLDALRERGRIELRSRS